MSRIITSPGLQITEKDLSLRVFQPAGTSVVVPGFAAQGPSSEPILVTSISEFESIFGYPTNAAERYLYYSCKEILNSPAILNVVRLPYGADGGSDFSKSFSGLFYPVTLNKEVTITAVVSSSTKTQAEAQAQIQTLIDDPNFKQFVSRDLTRYGTLTSVSLYNGVSGWQIGRPQSIILNEEDYGSVARGEFVWLNPDTTTGRANLWKAATTASDQASAGAGIFFINELQSTINEVGEGYYIAISDNTAVQADSPNYDSIKGMFSLSASTNSVAFFSKMPTTRLDFGLTATKVEADKGGDTISETLEKVGFADYERSGYADHLSIGIYKIRRSQADPLLLTLATNERYLGSVNESRKVLSPTGGGLVNNFIADTINSNSSNVRMYVNPAIKGFQWTAGSLDSVHKIYTTEEAKALFPLGVFTPDSRDQEKTKQVGNVALKLAKVLRSVDNPENITVDVLCDAGLSNVYATAKYRAQFSPYTDAQGNPLEGTALEDAKLDVRIDYDDEAGVPAYKDDPAGFEDFAKDWRTVVNEVINFSQNTRKDCVSIVDPPRSLFVAGKNTKILTLPDRNFTQDVYNPLKECTGPLDSNYSALYANWIQQADLFSGKKFWIPNSGYVAAVIARNDAVAAPWSAPAGLNRGQFQNALDVAINPNQKMRDRLYEIGVNPILYFAGDGYAVYGQKTLQSKPTAFDRMNVRRLFLYLEKDTAKTAQYFVFEPNTAFTRQRVVSTLSPIFSQVKSQQGLYDYMIVCDERNNPPDVVDQNELVIDIYLKPVRTAEFVLLNFIAARTGASFQELM
jgi:phage tail sheath protein FI